MNVRIVAALVVALVALLAFLLWRGEWMREELDRGYSSVALDDDLLAARMYLAQHAIAGRSVEVQGAGLALPPADGVLVFLASRLALSESAAARLAAWVQSGGHLITVPTSANEAMLFGRRDELLEQLGIGVRESEPAAADADEELADGRGHLTGRRHDHDVRYDRQGCALSPIAWAQLAAPREQLAFNMPTRARMRARLATAAGGAPSAPGRRQATVAVLAEDADGALLMSTAYGKGRVTVLAEGAIWLNQQVGCLDHARLLRRLVGPARTAWMVARAERPTLFDLLRRHGVSLLWPAAALLALWLWQAGSRYGTPWPSPTPARRQRAEALRAAGEYLWRYRAVSELLAGVRARVRRTARLRLGHADAIDALARRAGIAPEAARTAMNTDPRHERDLIATTRTLKELIDQS